MSIKGIGNYSMDYYGLEDGYFPPSGTVATDHWSYANSSNEYLCGQNRIDVGSISTVNSSTYVETLTGTRKEPDYYVSLLGIITKIYYPTQGSSSFTYEPNIYYRRVSRESADNFIPSPHVISGEGPGARIRRIANYNSDGTLADSTGYRYIKSDGTSSGTLLKYPRYIVQYGATVNGVPYLTADVSLATMGGLMSYDAVPIEYSRVEEILPDSSRTVYHFSGIDETDDMACNEYHPIEHLFEYAGQYCIAFASVPNVWRINHILAPESSMQSQRGKLIGREVFKKDGTTPLQKSVNNYNTQVELSYTTEHYGVGEYTGDVPLYTGDYPLTSTESTSYTTSDSVKQTVIYSYNSLGQKTREAKTQSNGDVLYTYYAYINDIDSTQRSVVEKAMYKANVIGYPVDITVKIRRSGEAAETVLSEEKYTFAQYANGGGYTDMPYFYRPQRVERLNIATGTLYTFGEFRYDNEGDMTEHKDANGLCNSYIWGSGGNGAVIKISNATNEQIKSISGLSGVFTSYPDSSDETTISALASTIKEALPFAEVSWYTYLKYGMPVKMGDPSGKVTTYSYDANDRLTVVKDSGGSNMEQYNYNTLTK
ncbi:MAG TPA: RHS repeat protein [Candidatus Egerieousia sp.]|nr:RHS repeat protein [Candidatus Egerieousia sp.]